MTEQQIQEEYRKCKESFEYWRDNYVFHKRSKDDWAEICRKMSEVFNTSLKDAVETYKQDRTKWIDWYNKDILKIEF